ncbi:unnamed protein product [Moneuplotes crassus]|uniref:Charged multivesicular body protein 7 n=2 Tax=Euplotes crassus TaxID=5936 RepID=A0AAD1ULV5_EUPCR|nr:unnamed protein product [Moneuplotes crassus]
MGDMFEVFEEQKQQRLQKFLENQHQLQDDKERHYLFLSYDHNEDEEHLYEFWRDMVNDLLGKVFKRTYASPEEICKCFTIKGQKPFGLVNILREMRLRKELIDPDELTDEVGWVSKKISAITSWFGSSNEELDTSSKLVSVTWLENICSSITTWAFKQETQIFNKKQIEAVLYKNGRDKEDVKLVLANLIKTDRMIIEGDYVKIGHSGEIEEFTNYEKATFKLNYAAEELQERINIIKPKITELKEKAKNALKEKNRDLATNLVREKKALERVENILEGQKMKIEKQVLDIQMTLSTKDTIEALKLSNNQQSIIDDDLDDAQELMDAITEKNYNLDKINKMFTSDDVEEEMDEDLLKELTEEPDEAEEEKQPSSPQKERYPDGLLEEFESPDKEYEEAQLEFA